MALGHVTTNIDSYMKDISAYDRITVQEENRLADLIHNGTEDEKRYAKDKLICANLRLVVKIAHDFKQYGLDFNDLVAEGNCGLVTAADKFDPSKGAKFSCYAAWWIKQAMRHAVAWQTRTIRVPGGSLARMQKINRARSRYMMDTGNEPTVEELMDMTGYSADQIENLGAAFVTTVSMNETLNDESATTFDSMISETVQDEDSYEALKHRLHDCLDMLSDLEQYIVRHTFGICAEMLDVKTIAQEIGLTIAMVRERLAMVMERLRELISGPLEA